MADREEETYLLIHLDCSGVRCPHKQINKIGFITARKRKKKTHIKYKAEEEEKLKLNIKA